MSVRRVGRLMVGASLLWVLAVGCERGGALSESSDKSVTLVATGHTRSSLEAGAAAAMGTATGTATTGATGADSDPRDLWREPSRAEAGIRPGDFGRKGLPSSPPREIKDFKRSEAAEKPQSGPQPAGEFKKDDGKNRSNRALASGYMPEDLPEAPVDTLSGGKRQPRKDRVARPSIRQPNESADEGADGDGRGERDRRNKDGVRGRAFDVPADNPAAEPAAKEAHREDEKVHNGGEFAFGDGHYNDDDAYDDDLATLEPLPPGTSDREQAALFEAGRRLSAVQTGQDPLAHVRPDRFLPDSLYFENTYLGGSAAHEERLRRLDTALSEGDRPYRLAASAAPTMDRPERAGLGVSARTDVAWFDGPRRVFLQVGLAGSGRYGWRRPPLDVVVVLAPGVASDRDVATSLLMAALGRLETGDRVGVVVSGAVPVVLSPLSRVDVARTLLSSRLASLSGGGAVAATGGLEAAMDAAATMLAAAAGSEAVVPGSQTVWVVASATDAAAAGEAAMVAHRLTEQGAVTSVLSMREAEPESESESEARGIESGRAARGDGPSDWWQVANAGHGNLHHWDADAPGEVIEAELEALSKVVARLVRVNVRLGKNAKAIRVLGTRILDEEEIAQVKAREVAIDKNLAARTGIAADRGDDDDGLQTVIPYFYGDDSHVLVLELWVDGPGTVADVTVRYKDMVNLDNATARTSVRLEARPLEASPEHLVIRDTSKDFRVADALQRAASRVRRGDQRGAISQLNRASSWAGIPRTRQLLRALRSQVVSGEWVNRPGAQWAVGESLQLAAERLVGAPPSMAAAGR